MAAAEVLVLSEATALRLVRQVRRGAAPRVLFVDPLWPPARPLLDRLLGWARARGARLLIEDYPEHAQEWAYPTLIFADDVLARIEPWQRGRVGFDRAGGDARHGGPLKLHASMDMWRPVMTG